MKVFYNKETKGFYPESMVDPENIPEGSVEISEELYNSLIEGQNNGKLISHEKDLPELIDPPETTPVMDAEVELFNRRSLANSKITPLQDAEDLGIITEDEASLLKKWKTYRVLLNRVDISKAPNITWPEIPEE
ncbi:tail fiber assembly protein [Yersinia phage vB_Yru_GN1]|uniref:Tail fiber assembly protein n=1 Tax=Yersinia phage vB_Yru_GN1 TaxID=3074381 RepID=A0AA86J4Z9_9CAUD|nr:tail fiber assembly protein [Yersinia phage vB_Yru_GN1]